MINKKRIIEGLIVATISIAISILLLPLFILPKLLPKTDITVDCGLLDYSLLMNFTNNADFSGEDFSIYIFEHSRTYSFPTYTIRNNDATRNLCNVSEYDTGAIINCVYIPPKSTFQIELISMKDELNEVDVEYWSKNTPYTNQRITCK